MPIYEFSCRGCGERFDRLQRMADPTPGCPSCGGADVARLISLVAGLPAGGRADAGPAGSGCGCGGACACGR